MLINLSNHPKSKWSEAQIRAAENAFGEVLDMPFPNLEAEITLREIREVIAEYAKSCMRDFERKVSNGKNAIHIMGEFTFTYQFVKEMERRGVLCVASTTGRRVVDNPDGSKTTYFDFVKFRPYNEI